MQSYPLAELGDARLKEVFEQAIAEPVLLTEESQPSYVILSAQNYQQLIQRLSELEDRLLGQSAKDALGRSHMVGTETFTAELERLAALDSGQ
ncbi:prevent-host-death protein [Microcoleus sp. FACHB-1515]|uniref:type II toxin-antitoxin system Phd/YefM family antitoxin n=1 Tax=Cyanophyceae TaxID=3028117 RepID=UPI001683EB56|nr:type II toxin-antitoxin system Phd/YefM family antitoxin [Microcoleus sp. FACHB-1515]MBD2089522.1 prevent-host-death protein [Microcoleus sp. FACHB-1515]